MTFTPMNSSLIIIPTYNEAENIFPLLAILREKVPFADILVVDDSSPDGTREKVILYQRHDDQVKLLDRVRKDGLAGAYFAGFNYATEKGYERILQMDADFSHDPDVAASMLNGLDEYDACLGTRYAAGGGTLGWSKLRELISRSGNLYATTVLRLPYKDVTGGYNAWRVSALKRLEYWTIASRGYVYQVELKTRAHRIGLRLKEIPFVFHERRSGTSKISGNIIFEAAWRVLKLINI